MTTQTDSTSNSISEQTSNALNLTNDEAYQAEIALRSLNRETSIKYMIFEQSRRSYDREGEDQKRAIAKKVSIMFRLEGKTASNLSFGMAVRDALKKAASQIAANTMQATESTESAGKKGWTLLRSKIEDASKIKIIPESSEAKIDHAVSEARIAFANSTLQITKIADTIGEKGSSAAIGATNKGAELMVRGKTGLELVLYHARNFIKEITIRFSGWISKTWNDAILRSHLNHSTLLEKREQKRRTVSDADETFAVLNAMRVSSLIKDLAPEFYRPSEEPSSYYAVHLLEAKERSRRISEDKLDKSLRARCKAFADMAVAAQTHAPKELAPAYTIESVIELPIKPAHIEAMQVFEEHRSINEMISAVTPVSPPPKVFADITDCDSPTARSAAM